MIFESLTFWTLLAGVLVYALKFFVPSFPFTVDQVVMFFVFLLGFVNIYPSLMQKRLLGLSWTDILWSKAFLVLVVGLVSFIATFYVPTFPLNTDILLQVVIFVLGLFNIYPELRAKAARAKFLASSKKR